jgi:hypothetical protein
MYSESSVLRFFSQNVTVKMQKTTDVILVLVQNLVSHIKGRIYNQDIWEQSAKVWLNSDGETGSWRKLHNEDIRNFYSTPHIFKVIQSRIIKWTETCSKHGRDEKCIQNVIRKTLREQTTLETWPTYEDNIKRNFKGMR